MRQRTDQFILPSRSNGIRAIVLGTIVGVLSTIAVAGFVKATPGTGVTSTVFAVGAFDTLDAKTLTDIDPDPDVTRYWQARITTKGATDVHVIENRLAPGGTFGWHTP